MPYAIYGPHCSVAKLVKCDSDKQIIFLHPIANLEHAPDKYLLMIYCVQ